MREDEFIISKHIDNIIRLIEKYDFDGAKNQTIYLTKIAQENLSLIDYKDIFIKYTHCLEILMNRLKLSISNEDPESLSRKVDDTLLFLVDNVARIKDEVGKELDKLIAEDKKKKSRKWYQIF